MSSLNTDRRNIARAAIALFAAAALTGCASTSRTTLGRAGGGFDQPAMGAGDALGAAMFSEHVRLAALEARQRRGVIRDYATVQVPTE